MKARLRIDRLGARGDGVAETEGGPVYAPFTLPGELVEGTPERGRLEDARVLEPSPMRVAPPCPHFGRCGGCLLQHAHGDLLARWKRERIFEALARRGIEGVEFRPVAVSPPASRRRVVLSARRTKRGVTLGFHGWRSEAIVAVETCLVAAPSVVAALPALREAAAAVASRKGEVKLHVAASGAGLDVDIRGGKPADAAAAARLAAIARAADWARLSLEGEPMAARRPPLFRFGLAEVAPPPGAFLQATAEGEAALVAAAREAVGAAGRIADLFAGCGAFALPLAERAELRAVEAEAPMLEALASGWRGAAGRLRRVETEARDLFRRPLVPEELARFDAVVIDPPRAGAAAQCEALALGGPPRIASISCEPATFARDARILIDGGYRLDWILPVDQFLWSPHVELAAQFSRS